MEETTSTEPTKKSKSKASLKDKTSESADLPPPGKRSKSKSRERVTESGASDLDEKPKSKTKSKAPNSEASQGKSKSSLKDTTAESADLPQKEKSKSKTKDRTSDSTAVKPKSKASLKDTTGESADLSTEEKPKSKKKAKSSESAASHDKKSKQKTINETAESADSPPIEKPKKKKTTDPAPSRRDEKESKSKDKLDRDEKRTKPKHKVAAAAPMAAAVVEKPSDVTTQESTAVAKESEVTTAASDSTAPAPKKKGPKMRTERVGDSVPVPREAKEPSDNGLPPVVYVAIGAALVVILILAAFGLYWVIKQNMHDTKPGATESVPGPGIMTPAGETAAGDLSTTKPNYLPPPPSPVSPPPTSTGPTTTPRPTVKWDTEIELCNSNDCREVKMLMDASLDKGREPCQDFYAFVCSEAERNYATMYDTVQGGTLKVLEHNISTEIGKEIRSPVPLQGQTVIQKSAAFFQHCRDVKMAVDSNFDRMKLLLEEHGMTFKEDMSFDALDVTVKFAFELGIQLWYNFSAERIGSEYDVVVERYSGLLQERFVWSSRGSDIEKADYAGQVVLRNIFGRRLDAIYVRDLVQAIELVYNTGIFTRLGAQKRIPLSTLLDDDVNSALTRQWTTILSRYSNQRLPGNVYVKVHDGDQKLFRSAFTVENNTDAVRRYIAWRTADTLYTTGAQAVAKDTPRDIEDHCLAFVQSMLPYTIGPSVLFKTVNEQRVNAVKTMLREIVDAVDGSFAQSTVFDDNTRNDARKKLSLLKSNIGYHHSKFDTQEKVRDHYRDLPDLTGPFIDDFIKVKRFLTTTYWYHIFRSDVDFINNLYSAQVPVFEANAKYTAEMNLLTIPPAMMYSPLFALGGPPDVNYGALGRLMAHYIMRGYDEEGIHFDGTGAPSSWFSRESSRRYEDFIECVSRSAQVAPGERYKATSRNEELADVLGNIPLLNAYKKAKGSSDKLFYVSWCLLWCGRRSAPFVPSDDLRCNLPLMNSDHFRDTFACPHNSPMNPPQKCKI
ncbi:neprilysin-1-like [Ornithodoros turicata]|uniref:neprilysin-1-like n=1 Tax=Ornithodoros turicata TaxID=34597 RepID=UPI0031398096